MRGASEVRFARVGLKAKRSGQRCFCGRQSRGSVVSGDQEIKLVVCVGQLAVSEKERRIARQSLVQQIYRLKNAFTTHRAESCAKQEIFGATIKIECRDIRRGRFFNCRLLVRRKFRLELIGYGCSDFSMCGYNISEVAIVSLRPKMCVI